MDVQISGKRSKVRRSSYETSGDEARRPLSYEVGSLSRSLFRLAESRSPRLRSQLESLEGYSFSDRRVSEETFGRLYNPQAPKVEGVEEGERYKFSEYVHSVLDGMPDFRRAQIHCERDLTLSTLTSLRLNEVVEDCASSYVAEETVEDTRGKLQGKAKRAVEDAREDLEGVVTMLGYDLGSRDRLDDVDPSTVLELADMVVRDGKTYREFLRLLGKFRELFASSKRSLSSGGATQPISVHPSGDIRTLLPAEKLALANPSTTLIALQRLQLRQALCYKLRDRKRKALGSFYVLLDCSDSMDWSRGREPNAPIQKAKAFALAAMIEASRQGREVKLGLFSHGASSVPIDLSTPRSKVESFRSVAAIGVGGGTNLSSAFELARKDRSPKMDVLLISDGEGELYERDLRWLDEEKAGLYFVRIGECRGLGSDKLLTEQAEVSVEVSEQIRDEELSKLSDIGVRASGVLRRNEEIG